MNHNVANNGRSLAEIANEIKQETKEFAQTRIELLKTELSEKLDRVKKAAPITVVGVLFLSTAYLLLTVTVVCLAAVLIGDTPWRWVFAFLAVTVLWSIIGGIALYLGIRELQPKSLLPQRTIGVLRDDKIWVQREVKNQI